MNQTSWENVASWYDALVGEKGGYFHTHVIFPRIMPLLSLKPKMKVLDIACGRCIEGVEECTGELKQYVINAKYWEHILDNDLIGKRVEGTIITHHDDSKTALLDSIKPKLYTTGKSGNIASLQINRNEKMNFGEKIYTFTAMLFLLPFIIISKIFKRTNAET